MWQKLVKVKKRSRSDFEVKGHDLLQYNELAWLFSAIKQNLICHIMQICFYYEIFSSCFKAVLGSINWCYWYSWIIFISKLTILFWVCTIHFSNIVDWQTSNMLCIFFQVYFSVSAPFWYREFQEMTPGPVLQHIKFNVLYTPVKMLPCLALKNEVSQLYFVLRNNMSHLHIWVIIQ